MSKRINLRMDDETMQLLADVCAERGMGMTEVIKASIRVYAGAEGVHTRHGKNRRRRQDRAPTGSSESPKSAALAQAAAESAALVLANADGPSSASAAAARTARATKYGYKCSDGRLYVNRIRQADGRWKLFAMDGSVVEDVEIVE